MPNTDGLVLEVGCGVSRTKKYKNWIGLDFGPIVKPTIVADVNHLPFRNNSFSLVYSFGLIEHFEDPLKVIKEMKRVSPKVYFGIPKANKLALAINNLYNRLGWNWIFPKEYYYFEKDFPMCKKIKTILNIVDFYRC